METERDPDEIRSIVKEVVLDQLEPKSGMISPDDRLVDSADITDGKKGVLGIEPADLLAIRFRLRKKLGLEKVDPQAAMAFLFAGSDPKTVEHARDLGYFQDTVKVEGGGEGEGPLQVAGSVVALEQVGDTKPLTVARLQELFVRECSSAG
ncbi:MAG: hypothetical protein WCX61_00940 [Candidatus Peribacteraceae bacterium]